MTSFGINGFGRIGRTAARVWWQKKTDELDLVMINTSGSMEIEEWAHLFKYDSNYGIFSGEITTKRLQSKDEVNDENPVLGEIILSDGQKQKSIVVTAQRDPAKLPWGEHQVEVVIESTGVFRTQEKAAPHLTSGASWVIISAPPKDGQVKQTIIGVNQLDKDQQIISNASCTTNSVAPVAQIMQIEFGVEKAMLTTIHSYTDSQNLVDNSHKDMRRARSAATNLVPTTTGAAKATTEVIPELKDKFDGLAIRVPTPVGSISDMVFLTSRDVTVEEVNQVFSQAAQKPEWQGILAVTSEPIVSSDIVGRDESAIVDLNLTQVVGGNLVKVMSWYDNEWAYCYRLLNQAELLK